jgi:steroid delta-isomerase-like uncharacterized protein
MASAAEIHRQMADAWNRRDMNIFKALLHPEYTYTGGDGREMAGPEAGLNMAQMFALAFPDGRLEVQRVYTQGNTAIAEMVGRGTHRGKLMGVAPTGREVEILICNVVELRDGKIYREREYMDMLTLMSQIGAMTLPGEAAGTAHL